MNVPEKILEEIDKKADYYECEEQGREHIRMVDMVDVEEIIRSHMDVGKDINVPSKDGWIPVEERLPEKTDYYLVQLSRKLPNEDYSDRVVVLFNGEEKEFECYANLINAWQPLPKPYRPDPCRGCFGAANNDCRNCDKI